MLFNGDFESGGLSPDHSGRSYRAPPSNPARAEAAVWDCMWFRPPEQLRRSSYIRKSSAPLVRQHQSPAPSAIGICPAPTPPNCASNSAAALTARRGHSAHAYRVYAKATGTAPPPAPLPYLSGAGTAYEMTWCWCPWTNAGVGVNPLQNGDFRNAFDRHLDKFRRLPQHHQQHTDCIRARAV